MKTTKYKVINKDTGLVEGIFSQDELEHIGFKADHFVIVEV